jgi:hypothetical protein
MAVLGIGGRAAPGVVSWVRGLVEVGVMETVIVNEFDTLLAGVAQLVSINSTILGVLCFMAGVQLWQVFWAASNSHRQDIL